MIMKCLTDNSRITRLNYLYLFCIIIYAGSATEFARSLGNIATVGNAFALLLTIIFIVKKQIIFNRRYLCSLVVFTVYAVATFIANKLINPLWLSQWYIWLTIAYVICQCYGKRLFVIYETIIYHLCIVALVFWGIYIIFPSLITSIVSILQFNNSYTDDVQSKNMIVYTLMEESRALNNFVKIPRNAGFAWEPGAFASFICLAIYCNIIRTNFKLNDKKIVVFILALISTQSTTGFIILIAMIAFWLIFSKRTYYAAILLPVILFMFQLPFVHNKIMDEYNNVSYVDISQFSKSTALGRMASLQLDWNEFLLHPILGLGGYTDGTWLVRQGYDNIATISGIGKMLSMYGIIMTFLFVFLLIKSSIRIADLSNSSMKYLLLVPIIGIMFSYNLWLQPIYISFWLYFYYEKQIK